MGLETQRFIREARPCASASEDRQGSHQCGNKVWRGNSQDVQRVEGRGTASPASGRFVEEQDEVPERTELETGLSEDE